MLRESSHEHHILPVRCGECFFSRLKLVLSTPSIAFSRFLPWVGFQRRVFFSFCFRTRDKNSQHNTYNKSRDNKFFIIFRTRKIFTTSTTTAPIMSHSTTPNTASSEPRLCKMGCGFFVSIKHSICCSGD